MMRGSQAEAAEAFARLLDGAGVDGPRAGALLNLSGVAAALGNLPVPTVPAGLAAGRAAFMQAATAHAASVTSFAPTATLAGKALGGKAVSGKVVGSKAVGSKAGILGLLSGHLVPLAAGTAVIAVGAAGVAVGASRSLPGDPFYGVKRSIESLQVDTAGGRISTAEEQLAQASTRLQEAAALRQQTGGAAHVPGEVAAWMAGETAAVKVLLPLASQPRIRAELTEFLATSSAGLAAMPAGSVVAATKALAALAGGLGLTPPTVATLTRPLSLPVPSLPPPASPLSPGKTQTRPPVSLPTSLNPFATTNPGVIPTPSTRPAASAGVPHTGTSPVKTSPVAVSPSIIPSPVATAVPSSPAVLPLPSAVVPSAPTLPTVVPSDVVGTITTLLPTALPKP